MFRHSLFSAPVLCVFCFAMFYYFAEISFMIVGLFDTGALPGKQEILWCAKNPAVVQGQCNCCRCHGRKTTPPRWGMDPLLSNSRITSEEILCNAWRCWFMSDTSARIVYSRACSPNVNCYFLSRIIFRSCVSSTKALWGVLPFAVLSDTR